MKHIEEVRLEHDLDYRFNYLCEFIGFGAAEIDTVLSSAPLLAPAVPTLVDAVYEKLHTYDSTWRHFAPLQSGYMGNLPVEGAVPEMEHQVIKFRKEKLAQYLCRLVTGPYDSRMVKYLDFVGAIHTAKAGAANIEVPLIQMNALMGFVADALTATIYALPLSPEDKLRTLRAFGKLLWIQNDLITRHYQTK